MLLRDLTSLDGKLEHFVKKMWEKRLTNSSQTGYRRSINWEHLGKCVSHYAEATYNVWKLSKLSHVGIHCKLFLSTIK